MFSSNRISKTPAVEVFKRFKKHWNEIWQQFDGKFVSLVVTSEILQKYQNLKNLSVLCDDYKELVKLALIYIEIQLLHSITLQRPEAFSEVRWMSKNIYSLKIILLSKQNSLETIIDTTCLKKLNALLIFA